jgi:rhamnosyltransferase
VGSYIPPSKENTCCIVVTFHPGPELTTTLARLADQLDAIILIDNASGTPETEMLRSLAAAPGVQLIQNHANRGLAAALNQGLDLANARPYDWVLILDQDTIPSSHIVASYAKILASIPNPEKVAILGSNFIDPHFGSGVCPDGAITGWQETRVVITSGMLVSTVAATAVGPFRADFFVDLVDHEYCLRTASQGYKIVISREPLIEHTIGNPRLCRFLGKTLLTTDASPERRYYVARNSAILWKEYRRLQPTWIKAAIRLRAKEVLLMLVFERHKARKSWSVLRGLVDGLRARRSG